MDKSFIREIKKLDKDMNIKKSCKVLILDKVAHPAPKEENKESKEAK